MRTQAPKPGTVEQRLGDWLNKYQSTGIAQQAQSLAVRLCIAPDRLATRHPHTGCLSLTTALRTSANPVAWPGQ